MEIRQATDMDRVRELFREYQTAVDAPVCFTTFDEELAGLPAPYVAILVAWIDGQAAGCVALKPLTAACGPLSETCAEVKRLYVRPAFRGRALARHLMEQVSRTAAELGYQRLRLDTLPTMTAAIALYRALGFSPISRYNDNPFAGTLFFERSIPQL